MRILHISDLHFWSITCNPILLLNKRIIGNLNLIARRCRYIHQERADSFIEVVNDIRPDILLVGGDLTTTALAREYAKAAGFLSRLESFCPVIRAIPGNHDYYTFESCRHNRYEKYLGRYSGWAGEPVSCQSMGDISLVCIPTVRANICSSRGFISEAHAAATLTVIQKAPGKQIIALAHYPYLQRVPEYHSGRTRCLGGASLLRETLGRSGRPLLYLAGHVHVFSHRRDSLYNHLTQVTSAALFYGKKKQPGGFTEICMNGDTLQIFPWTFCDGWLRGKESLPMPG